MPVWGNVPSRPDSDPTTLTRASGFRFRTYTDTEGLPQNLVQAIARDRNGYLWVGTQNGAAYYNGRAWMPVAMPNKGRSNLINQNALFVDSENGVWFGTRDSGVVRLLDGQWTVYDSKAGLAGDNVNAILETKDEKTGERVFWFGTYDGGLSRLQGNDLQTVDVKSGLAGNRVLCILETREADGKGTLWVGTDGAGLAGFRDGKWKTYTVADGLPDNKIWSLLASRDESGTPFLWVGTDGGLAKFQNGVWTRVETSPNLSSNSIYCLAETVLSYGGGRTLWVGTLGGGLGMFRNGEWTAFTTDKGLPSNFVRSLLVVPGGAASETLWIGTDGGGISRLESPPWVPLVTPPELKNKIQQIIEVPNPDGTSTFWAATVGDGVFRFEKGAWTQFDKRSGLAENLVRSLLAVRDSTGKVTLWAGTNNGVSAYRDGKWTTYSTESGLADRVVFCLLETRSSDGKSFLWAGTSGGLSRFSDGKWVPYSKGSGLSHDSIRCLLETETDDGKPLLWVGSLGGLSCLNDGKWINFTTAEGLGKNYVRCLLEARLPNGSRRLLVGTDGGGVFQLDASRGVDEQTRIVPVLTETTTPAFPNLIVFSMFQARDGLVYFLTVKGLMSLSLDSSGRPDGRFYVHTIHDGLPSNECHTTTGFVDRAGRLWVGTIKGVVGMDPDHAERDVTAKPIRIERMTAAGEAFRGVGVGAPIRDGLEYSYRQNNFRFEVALLSFFRESDNRYQTQLVGLEAAPTDWTEDFDREYNYLPEGKYVFRVWGKDYAGNVSGPAEFSFVVKPAPWRTWLAYAVYLSVGLMILFGLVAFREERLLQRNRTLQHLVEERTAEVLVREEKLKAANQELEQANAELKDLNTLKTEFLGIAAHDLKNPLTVIMAFSELMTLDPHTPRSTVTIAEKIFSSSRRMLTIIGSLLDASALESKKLNLVKSPCDIRRLAESVVENNRVRAEAKQLKLFFEADRNADWTAEIDENRMQAVFDNLVSNAVKYSPSERAVRVSMTQNETEIEFSVADQGPGLTDADKEKLFGKFQRLSAKPTGGESSTGLGLSIVKQLVELHGGRTTVAGEPGMGSTFTVIVPRR